MKKPTKGDYLIAFITLSAAIACFASKNGDLCAIGIILSIISVIAWGAILDYKGRTK